jgi:polysaccharide chain length determinant protein (PEP-CTERM system associated)
MISKPPPPPALVFSPLSVLKAIWNHKLLVVVCWAAITAAVVAVVHRLPAVYSADAMVQVESQRIPEKYVTATVNADLQDRVSVLRQQLLSYTRLWGIIEQFNLYKDLRKKQTKEEVVEIFRKDITITFEKGLAVGRPGSFKVSYRGADPSTVARVANLISNFFIEENLRAREVEAVGTSEFLENQLAEAKKRLEEQERQLSEYKTEFNGELPEQENALLSSLGQFKVQLVGAQDRITREQQNKLMLQTALENAETSQITMDRLEIARADAALYGAISGTTVAPGALPVRETERLRQQLATLRLHYTEAHPDVKRAVDALKRAEEREAQIDAGPRTAPGRASSPAGTNTPATRSQQQNAASIGMQDRIQSLKMQIAVSEREMQTVQHEQERLIREMGSLEARIQKLPIREQQMASITRDYEVTKANYRSLLDRKMSADVAADMERRQKAERFIMLDLARTPEKPIQPKRELLSAGGSVLGLVLGLALALMIDLRKGVLLGEWELPGNVVVLGRIPQMASGRRSWATGGPSASAWKRPVGVTATVGVLGAVCWLLYALGHRWPMF